MVVEQVERQVLAFLKSHPKTFSSFMRTDLGDDGERIEPLLALDIAW
jgi:hypothetical protein